MNAEDGYQILVCKTCGEEFALTSEALKFLEQRGFEGKPKWCRTCFIKRKRTQRLERMTSDLPHRTDD